MAGANALIQIVTQAGSGKSISDDDLCAGCKQCRYSPGEHSTCSAGWPGMEDGDGYVQECASFDHIKEPGENLVC